MRELLDCGVLLAPGHERAMDDWVDGHQARLTRVRLHPVLLGPRPHASGADASPPAPDALVRLAVALRRYDGCILPVAPGSLAWARMALQQASQALSTPILLLIHDMKAPAILDLLNLGAADFIAEPVCLESMRVRLDRLARPAAWRDAGRAGGAQQGSVQQGGVQELPASYLGPPRDAGGARFPVPPRPRVSTDVVEQALASMRHQHRRLAQESFRAAKAQVVDGFEREYIRHALSRHGGNVAQAARACAKHRRAFWALMRKHGIDAAPYRQAAQGRDF
ncbi:Bacterial regulatory protein, Fis family [compost metagenome]|uniref:helix-turn-helix domain-containing protein n=1 Tax=Achromobacter sp. Root83 TaxID=1736602 RepID=UPI000B104A67|nr:helix-turn-helix domain-containing protein [Achromobacter sp. Root83]